jgi:GNAT superfamily N-acetyltransferase
MNAEANAIQTLINNTEIRATNDVLKTAIAKHIKFLCEEPTNPYRLPVLEEMLSALQEKRLWIAVAQVNLNTHQDRDYFANAGCDFDTLPAFAITTNNDELYMLWVRPILRNTTLGTRLIHAIRNEIGDEFDSSRRIVLTNQRGLD